MDEENVLFIGSVYEPRKSDEYYRKSHTNLQIAVNTHQWNIIKALELIFPGSLSILNNRYLPEFPKYQDVHIPKHYWQSFNGTPGISIGFINIKGIKQLIRLRKVKAETLRWVNLHSQTNRIIVCYYTNIPIMNAAISAKKLDPSIKTVLIVPDLPMYMDLSNRQKGNKISMIVRQKTQSLIDQFDSFVILTEDMKYPLNIGSRPYIVMEGIVDPLDAISDEEIKSRTYAGKTILYSGSLHEKYGVGYLLEAFKKIEAMDWNLEIFGSGEMEGIIRAAEILDARIKYYGFQNRESVISHQRKASILVNPRSNVEEFTKYSFPSKNLEYLLSGTPVLACALPGIPEEYSEVIRLLPQIDAESLYRALLEMMQLPDFELRNIGKRARDFAVTHKSVPAQAKALQNFISSI